jgi:hypothetical protein
MRRDLPGGEDGVKSLSKECEVAATRMRVSEHAGVRA